MKFALSFLALVSVASARVYQPQGDVPLDSALGQRLLEKATVVQESRYLNNNNQNSFLTKYAIKYLGCAGLIQVNAEGNANNNEGILSTNNLVRFALCPADSCSACTGGGEYVVNMYDFVDAYTEYKLTEQELTCENLREASNCENANDEANCESDYFTNAGHTECIDYEGDADFEVQRYLQCGELKQQNNNNNNNNGQQQQYFVGAYCSPKDGKSIYMGVFTDNGCVTKGDASVFSANYGMDLPFASTSMVSSECISCVETNNNNNNNNGEYQIAEICQQTYENAAKCETNMDSYYKDTSACDYIQNILPRLEAASRSIGGGSSKSSASSSSKAATALAWVFAATTIMFGAYAYFLYRKIKRGSVNLSSQDGAIA